MNRQLYGGYILTSVKEALISFNNEIDVNDMLRKLSCFDVYFNFEEKKSDAQILSVLHNIISRGLPTLASVFLEDSLSEKFDIAEKEYNNRTGEILYNRKEKLEHLSEKILKAFCVIDPRIGVNNIPEKIKATFDSQEEEYFYSHIIPNHFHRSLIQLIEPQRYFENIIENSTSKKKEYNNELSNTYHQFRKQKVDFSIDLPAAWGHVAGIVIEIDGSQHYDESQQNLDKSRNSVLDGLGWAPTLRIKTSELNAISKEKKELLHNYLNHPYIKIIESNYEHPLFNELNGLEALQIALSPMAIARLQKTILFLLSNKVLNFDQESWRIAVIERDVPCAYLAMKDLEQLCNHLFTLEGRGKRFPKIELSVFNTEEFKKCALNDGYPARSLSGFKYDTSWDAIIDISMLQRGYFSYPEIDIPQEAENYVIVRTSYSMREPRLVHSAKPIIYEIPENKQPEPLVYFLNNIFRKIAFREGQVEILRKTLRLKNVIALLPTGAGKSLTYQLSVLLQPGIALIIDPLKSLMRDQNDNLMAAGLDSTAFINSSLRTIERKIVSEKMAKGFYQFVFISPERLQIGEFRDYLTSMHETYFTYCVVDEAHCVSEWGHDFRTAYLRLGQNARKYCKTLADKIPIIGLTGTASFDVLADVQRELDINDISAIVAPSKYERDELNFKIKVIRNVEIPENADDFKIKEIVADAKKSALIRLLYDIPKHNWGKEEQEENLEIFLSRSKKYKNAGIIFCPHVDWKFGVIHIAGELRKVFNTVGDIIDIYAGKLEDDDSIDLAEVQQNFKNDKIGLLVATKAFGMGIDKPNIRFTIHFNMPQSIEAFYQEAGRAGRDRNPAYCYILYSPVKVNGDETKQSVDKSLMMAFYKNSFRGIDKEKRVMWELLNEITFPQMTLDNKLNFINLELEQAVKFALWPKDNPTRLYVNGDYPKSYGYIDLNTQQIYPETGVDRAAEEERKLYEILSFVLEKILNKCPYNVSLKDWLLHVEKMEPQPGFEKILTKMSYGEEKKVTVGFINDRFQKISGILSRLDSKWNSWMVLRAMKYCFEPAEFLEKLKKEYYRATKKECQFEPVLMEKLAKLFMQTRDEQDTFKAIYRLSVIGLIDEYEVDYNANSIIATIVKKKDEEYISALQNYIGRYVSPEEKRRVPEKILASKGNTILQKCCGYLVQFVYSKIAAKRLEAINVMESAIQTGVKNGNFEEFVNTYFDSRFTPKLREYLYEFSIDIVWEFMELSGGDPDQINHLRGACDRLLVENPENAAFLLLRSFARFLIPQYDKQEALNDFKKGWKLFVDLKNWSRKDYLLNLSKFYRLLIRYDSTQAKYLNQIILIEHLKWIKQFNQKFIKGNFYVRSGQNQ